MKSILKPDHLVTLGALFVLCRFPSSLLHSSTLLSAFSVPSTTNTAVNIRKPLPPQSLHAGGSPGWKRPKCCHIHQLTMHEIVLWPSQAKTLSHHSLPHPSCQSNQEGDSPSHLPLVAMGGQASAQKSEKLRVPCVEWAGPWLFLTPHLKQHYSPSKHITLLEITADAQVPFKLGDMGPLSLRLSG